MKKGGKMTFAQNLLDLIEILIAFTFIMLLLSLIVTALVQFIQATFRLRSRNLKRGLISLLDGTVGKKKTNVEDVENIMDSSNLAVIARAKYMKKGRKLISKIAGPTVSYIAQDVLIKALDSVKLNIEKEDIKALESRINDIWERLGKYMEKRFSFIIRVVSFVCAFIVSFSFQVSTPDLLQKLSVDSEFRLKIITAAEDQYKDFESKINVSNVYEDVSREALLKLTEQYKDNPDVQKKLEEVSGSSKDKKSLLEEMEIVFEGFKSGDVDAKAILTSYETGLDNILKEKKQSYLNDLDNYITTFGKFNISFWSKGQDFYKDFKNIIGVLITAIFLSFGAPFWFKLLKTAIRLKDILSEGIKKEDEENT